MIIAQLSDIHAAPDNDNLARFDNALAWLTPLEPDVLVISGDLTDDHWRDGYSAIAARLETLPCRTLILPGNSDDCAAMRAVWPSLAQEGPLHAVVDTPALRVIGLDSTVDGSAAGSVAAHLDWLARQLDEADGRQTLLFLHHHVFMSGIPSMDTAECCAITRQRRSRLPQGTFTVRQRECWPVFRLTSAVRSARRTRYGWVARTCLRSSIRPR